MLSLLNSVSGYLRVSPIFLESFGLNIGLVLFHLPFEGDGGGVETRSLDVAQPGLELMIHLLGLPKTRGISSISRFLQHFENVFSSVFLLQEGVVCMIWKWGLV